MTCICVILSRKFPNFTSVYLIDKDYCTQQYKNPGIAYEIIPTVEFFHHRYRNTAINKFIETLIIAILIKRL